MGIKLSDFIKDPHNVFTQEEAEMIYLAGLEEENKRLREALEHIERIQSVDVAQQIARQALKE